jgi:hypothetical protein
MMGTPVGEGSGESEEYVYIPPLQSVSSAICVRIRGDSLVRPFRPSASRERRIQAKLRLLERHSDEVSANMRALFVRECERLHYESRRCEVRLEREREKQRQRDRDREWRQKDRESRAVPMTPGMRHALGLSETPAPRQKAPTQGQRPVSGRDAFSETQRRADPIGRAPSPSVAGMIANMSHRRNPLIPRSTPKSITAYPDFSDRRGFTPSQHMSADILATVSRAIDDLHGYDAYISRIKQRHLDLLETEKNQSRAKPPGPVP